ncbi:Hpt domain-containing protein [Lishizhenia tianjinensis]|uniref:Hpt domain-containing protein n=1 Tax=Lishizhenia tianjinensis TaxID=477690 RepID=A0A1I7AXU3_9FLAO|nr:Hpt domain-containing protein [Lishizhenia tianjinensis]SFT79764.1 Hpt domain-containing protein [Lishizhenia tianjinensis]
MEIDEKIASQYTPTVFHKALTMFVESNKELVKGLQANDEDEEFKTLHKLKGGANMLGLKQIGKYIELAEADPLNKAHIEAIRTEFENIVAYSLQNSPS